jgi:hypothetical protein
MPAEQSTGVNHRHACAAKTDGAPPDWARLEFLLLSDRRRQPASFWQAAKSHFSGWPEDDVHFYTDLIQ